MLILKKLLEVEAEDQAISYHHSLVSELADLGARCQVNLLEVLVGQQILVRLLLHRAILRLLCDLEVVGGIGFVGVEAGHLDQLLDLDHDVEQNLHEFELIVQDLFLVDTMDDGQFEAPEIVLLGGDELSNFVELLELFFRHACFLIHVDIVIVEEVEAFEIVDD